MRFLLILLPALAAAPCLAAKGPNIVVILADDLGYGDLGCYNAASKIPTPNLDKLAAAGMRLTTAYCPASVCSPTRYGLMTGAYPWRSWKKRGVLGNWDRPMIEDGQATLASLLKNAGYTTGGFGKWHLGAKYATTDGKPPAGQGKFKGEGSGENIDITRPVAGGPPDRGFDEWHGMVCPSELLLFEGRKVSATVMHDLYEPMKIPGAAELPRLAIADLLPLTAKDCVSFIRRHAEDERPFFLYFAPYVPHIPLAVAADFRGKTRAGDYGDYVHELDHHIGLVLAALDEAGIAENTLVVFTSDNGSQFDTTGEGHHPNAPWTGGKWSIHEGGLRTPFIARWPAKIPAGKQSGALFMLNDLFATLAAATGREVPSGQAPDSLNLLPVLFGAEPEKPIRTEAMFRASQPHGALRQDHWKYVKLNEGKSAALYDLDADPSEKENLAAKEPDRLAAMAARFRKLMDESQKPAK